MTRPIWGHPYPHRRLMALSAAGRVYVRYTGALAYLLRLAAKPRRPAGRSWVEWSGEPAVLTDTKGYPR